MPKKKTPEPLTQDEQALLEAARWFRRLADARQILDYAIRLSWEGIAKGPLDLLAAAVRAAEWHDSLHPADGSPRPTTAPMPEAMYGAGAPLDVNPLLLPMVIGDVERVRAGKEPGCGLTRPRLRQLLAEAVPRGRQGKARSRLPGEVAWGRALGLTDEEIMKRLRVASPGAIRVLISQARKKASPELLAALANSTQSRSSQNTALDSRPPSAERAGRKRDTHDDEAQPQPPQARRSAPRLPPGRPPAPRRDQSERPPEHDRRGSPPSHPARPRRPRPGG